MEAEHDSTSIVGRPTLMATFDGHREAQSVLDALKPTGHPVEDISVLLRPAGTDAVEDLITGERPAGQSGDARLLSDKGSKTLVLLHPEVGQVEAIRTALNGLGAENIEYEPETIYTGAQSAEDMLRAAGVSAREIHQEVVQDEQQATQTTAADTSKKDQ